MNNIRNLVIVLSVLLMNIGCDDFLDQAPDERLEINTLEKVEKTVIGSYQNSRDIRFTHFSSDDATLAKKVYAMDAIIEDLYTWGNFDGQNTDRVFRTQEHQDSPANFWYVAYSSISQINHALRALDQLTLEESEKEKADVIRGEALIVRSYYHFMLVNIFGKHYDVATANEDLGVPYVFEPETELIVHYKRETVDKTYELAEKDLLEGIKLIEGNTKRLTTNKYRFTLSTIYAYASRFYNFRNKDKNDVANVLSYGQKALEAYGGVEQMIPWTDYKENELLAIDVERPGVGMVRMSYSWIMYDFAYHMTQDTRQELLNNPFGYTDERLQIYYTKSGNIFIPAFYYTIDRQSYTLLAHDLFPVYEVILNMAEAHIRNENFDNAKEMMEVVGENVYRKYNNNDLTSANLKRFYGKADEKDAWIEYLLYERRMMFLLQGKRWFDIKRYHLDVEHTLMSGKKVKLSEIAPNMDYQIPLNAINDGMTPNK